MLRAAMRMRRPSLPMNGKLLGHTPVMTTARYAHLDTEPVKAAAESVSSAVAKSVLVGSWKAVINE